MLATILVAVAIGLSGPISDIRSLLKAQGFPNELGKNHSHFTYLGDVKQGYRRYSIYIVALIPPIAGVMAGLFLSSRAHCI